MRYSTFLSALCLLGASTLAIPQGSLHKPQQQVVSQAAISPGTILAALRESFVIPDVLSEDFNPVVSISLTYTNAHQTVNLGNVINPSNTTSRPVLQMSPLYGRWSESPTPTKHANKTYTLVLSDPDATSHSDPVKGQMCHWIATGILPVDMANDDGPQELELRSLTPVKDSALDVSELVDYLPPSPPPKTGFHRYVFVLLEPEKVKDNDRKLKKPKGRPHWGYKKQGKGVMKWAKKNHLVPIAANYFLAQHDEQ